jgi:hypothetical protein
MPNTVKEQPQSEEKEYDVKEEMSIFETARPG